jgi:mRNA-degrading endonuclease RelE of RelBE toxin-antitoxin system
MSYNLIFHPEAAKEYAEAFAWYEEKKKGLGKRFENMVEFRLNKIAVNPEIYGFSKGNFREALTDIFPYTIVYKVNKRKNEIYVSAIYHTSRNPKKKYRRVT